MNTENTIDRIRRANPVSDSDVLHQEPDQAEALFSSIVRRRDDMLDIRTKRLAVAPGPRRPWYRRPQTPLLAAAVVVIAIMVPAILIGGSDDGGFADQPEPTLPAVEQPSSVSTAPGDAVTTPEPVPSVPPTTVNVATAPPVFDELLVAGHLAMKTQMFTGPDGFPLIVYYYESEAAWFDGAPSEAGMGILRCLDSGCLEYDTVEIPYSLWPVAAWPPIEFAAMLPDGSPVLFGSESPEGATEDDPPKDGLALLLVCSDADCTEMERMLLEPANDPDFILNNPHVLIGEDGFPVIYFQSGAPPAEPSVGQIICADRLCSERRVNTLIENSYLGYLATDSDGRLIFMYSPDEAEVCEDLICSTGTSTIDPATLIGIEVLSPVLYPRSSVFDRNTPRLCLDPWCIERLDVPVEPIAGRGEPAGFVENWTNEDGMPVFLYATFPVDQDQGDPIPVDLIVVECADAACASMTSHVVAEPVTEEDVATGRWWDSDGAFSTWLHDDGVPMIAYGTLDGLHLIRCTDTTCTPPG